MRINLLKLSEEERRAYKLAQRWRERERIRSPLFPELQTVWNKETILARLSSFRNQVENIERQSLLDAKRFRRYAQELARSEQMAAWDNRCSKLPTGHHANFWFNLLEFELSVKICVSCRMPGAARLQTPAITKRPWVHEEYFWKTYITLNDRSRLVMDNLMKRAEAGEIAKDNPYMRP